MMMVVAMEMGHFRTRLPGSLHPGDGKDQNGCHEIQQEIPAGFLELLQQRG
jgi:hypothetical protein